MKEEYDLRKMKKRKNPYASDLIAREDDRKSCKGHFFRLVIEKYLSSKNEIVETIKWRYLKRKSCNGTCGNDNQRCFSLIDDVKEGGIDSLHLKYDELVPDAIYEAVYIPGGSDWETGTLLDWDWKMERVKDNG